MGMVLRRLIKKEENYEKMINIFFIFLLLLLVSLSGCIQKSDR